MVIEIIKGSIKMLEIMEIFIILVSVIHNILLMSETYTSYYTYINYYIQPIIGYIQATRGFTMFIGIIKMLKIIQKFMKMHENIKEFIEIIKEYI